VPEEKKRPEGEALWNVPVLTEMVNPLDVQVGNYYMNAEGNIVRIVGKYLRGAPGDGLRYGRLLFGEGYNTHKIRMIDAVQFCFEDENGLRYNSLGVSNRRNKKLTLVAEAEWDFTEPDGLFLKDGGRFIPERHGKKVAWILIKGG
jgi:hypothetical protein